MLSKLSIMKKLFILIFVVTASVVFSQDIRNTLLSGKWYAEGYVAKKEIKFTRKPISDKQVATAEFLPTGKINYCDMAEETYFDANGNEMTEPAKFHCSTIEGYEIKNNLIHIYWNNAKHWYFKIVQKGEMIGLIPIKAEDFK